VPRLHQIGKNGIQPIVNPLPAISAFWKEKTDIPLLIVTAAVAILCAPFLFGGRVLFWGVPLLQFYPWRWEALHALSAGFLPLWNPNLGMGAPLLANAQSALLYPPNLILFLFPMGGAQGWLVALHLILTGWGMSRLARELSIGRLGQVLSGLGLALCGYAVARAWFFSINAALAWLPWIILAGERLLRRRGWQSALWLALALTMQWLAGHWQTAWYTGLLLVFWMTVRAMQLPSAHGEPWWKRIGLAGIWTMLAGVAAFCFSAVQILPTIEYWLHSQRASGVDSSLAINYSFWPWRLLELAAPGFFGSPAWGNYHGFGNYWEDAVSLGALALALAIAAVVQRFRRRGIDGFPYGISLALIAAAIPLALGGWAPWSGFLERWAPGWNIFQAPTRITVWLEFGLALLVAAGAENWQRTSACNPRLLRWGSAAALALMLGGLAAPFVTPIPRSSAQAFASAGCFLFLGILLYGAKPWLEAGTRPRWLWSAATIVVVAISMLFVDDGLLPNGPAALYDSPNPAVNDIIIKTHGSRLYMPEPVRYTQTYARFLRFDTFSATSDWMQMRALELPNVNVLDAVPSANNFDPFVPSRYADFLASLDALPVGDQSRVLRMMGVGAVWRGGDATSQPDLVPVAGSLGRAWGVCAATWKLGADDSNQAVFDPEFDPSQRVILESGAGEEGAPCSERPTARLIPSRDPNHVAVQTQFPEAGFVVLADVNYPGWEAKVDGQMAPLLQADYLFRAVRVPAGAHLVEFEYRPLSFWAGLGVSLAAWMFLAGWIFVRRWMFRKMEKDSQI
jgi:hypothetical protein